MITNFSLLDTFLISKYQSSFVSVSEKPVSDRRGCPMNRNIVTARKGRTGKGVTKYTSEGQCDIHFMHGAQLGSVLSFKVVSNEEKWKNYGLAHLRKIFKTQKLSVQHFTEVQTFFDNFRVVFTVS